MHKMINNIYLLQNSQFHEVKENKRFTDNVIKIYNNSSSF